MRSSGERSVKSPEGKARKPGAALARTELAARIMGQKSLWLELMLVLVGLLAGYAGFVWWSQDPLATLSELSGQPERDTSTSVGTFTLAALGDPFEEGDGARTDARSEAFFSLSGGARLTLRPSSQVRFQRRAGKKGTLGLSVELGQVEVKVDAEPLSLSSVFGEFSLAPKTTLGLSRRGKRLSVSVNFGRVEVGRAGNLVQLEAGQTLELEIGGVVIEPDKTVPEQVKAPAQAPPPIQEVAFDLLVPVGESFTVHDPSPPTRVAFRADCPGSFRLEVGPESVTGEGPLTVHASEGPHSYLATCLVDQRRATGKFSVVREIAAKTLPHFAPRADVKTDGRKYTVLYQAKLPHVSVSWPNPPLAPRYSFELDGQVLPAQGPSYALRAPLLRPGVHRLAFIAHSVPERRSRATTLTIQADGSELAGYVGEPAGEFAAATRVPISGQALPGWTVSLDGRKIELDAARRFSLETEPQGTLAVMFSHPDRGTHYYLRRPRAAL